MGRNGYIIHVEDEEAHRNERREQARKRLEEQYRGYRVGQGSYRSGQEFSEEDYEAGFRDGYAHAMKEAGQGEGSMRDNMGTNTTNEMFRNSRYGH